MRPLQLDASTHTSGSALRLLCLGAHCDDIDIGCGGALLELLERHPGSQVTWITFSGTPQRQRELRASARRFLRRAAQSEVRCLDYRDGFFPGQFNDIKQTFEALKALPAPDIVFTHHLLDRHQDHRLIAELTWNTFRDHLVLEYEVPKYEGDLSTPSAYIALKSSNVERKIRILMSCYHSQSARRWFSSETFRASMRLRGVESNAESGWAEGFHARKIRIE